MNLAKDFREKARNALSGRWGLAVLTGFIASLLGAHTALGGSSSSPDTDEITDLAEVYFTEGYIAENVYVVILLLVLIVALVQLVVALIQLVISGPISLGYAKFNLNLIDGNNPQFGDVFAQFQRWGAGFVLQFLRGLYTALWTLLFLIPGIIASFRYAMAPYVLSENPHMSASEAIEESKRLMDGNKWRLFCLNLSFIGWDILCIFTLGIGYLWLRPYKEASYAAFYRDINSQVKDYSFEVKDWTEDDPIW